LRLSAEYFVTQKAADEVSRLIRRHVEIHQAISGMSPIRPVEVLVAGEESWAAQRMQEWDDLIAVFHSGVTDLDTDLAKMNFPQPVQQPRRWLHDLRG